MEHSKKNRSLLWRRFKRDRLAVFGLVILIVLIFMAVFSGVLIDYETQVIQIDMANRLQDPSWDHWMGTDSYGRDIMCRIIYGTRYSISLGFLVVTFSVLIGGTIGSVAGYFGGAIDNVLMRIMDVFLAIPSIVMAIAVVSVLGTGFKNLAIAITISNVPAFARLFRSTVLTVKDSEYIEAAKSIGTSTFRIITRHILPNTMGPIVVQATFSVASSILNAASLSFLGIGIEAPLPEWGAMLTEGKEFMRDTPWLVTFPGIAIASTVLSLNLLGDGLRDALDPRLKK